MQEGAEMCTPSDGCVKALVDHGHDWPGTSHGYNVIAQHHHARGRQRTKNALSAYAYSNYHGIGMNLLKYGR
jgi:hypothetical protein